MSKVLLTLTETELARRRGAIQRLLRPIAIAPSGPAVAMNRAEYSSDRKRMELVLATYDGPRPAGPFREWLFASKSPVLRASYFELWSSIDSKADWTLEHAYLHLVFVEPRSGKRSEVFALHCDPNEPASAPHAEYKRGLHVHVSAAPDPLQHCHITLNRRLTPPDWKDLSRLTEAWKDAIGMIADQVLTLTYPTAFPKRMSHRAGCSCTCDAA